MTPRKRQSQPDAPQWQALYITNNLQEAHVLAGKLRAHDIAALIHQEPGAMALGITLGNLGEIKILVKPADSERAERILFAAPQEQTQASGSDAQVFWQDDGDGEEYYVEDDEQE